MYLNTLPHRFFVNNGHGVLRDNRPNGGNVFLR